MLLVEKLLLLELQMMLMRHCCEEVPQTFLASLTNTVLNLLGVF